MCNAKDEKFKIKGNGRLLNFRPIVIISLCFCVGIFLCYHFSLMSLVVGVIVFCLAITALFIYFRKNKSKLIQITVFSLIFLLFFTLGVISFKTRITAYEKDNVAEGRYTVSAVVKDIRESECIYLTDVMLTEGNNVFALNSDLCLYVYSLPNNVGIGSNVTFTANIREYETIAYGKFNAYSILENTKYSATVSGNSIVVSGENKFNLFYFLRERIRITLFNNMEKEQAALSYAMLTGDESFVESELLNNFRYGGIAHIFAVSGLHIGVIYGVLFFVLKRIRMPWIVRCSIIFAFLFIYTGVCAFSASSVRALVMCTVLMTVTSAGLKYDRLNSVALASLVVLIINPAYLFSVGFSLSIAAVVGITLLSINIESLFKRIKCPAKIASAVGVCLSAQLGTAPVLLDSFGYLPALSLITNLIFVPILSAVFSVLFFGTLIACVFPFATDIILAVPELLLAVTVFPISVIDLKILLISGFSFGVFILAWYLILIILSDKINVKIIPKAITCILLSAIIGLGIYLKDFGIMQENDLLVGGGYGASFTYVNSNNDVLVSYGVPDKDDLRDFVLRNSINSVYAIIVLGDSSEINSAVPVLLSEIDIENLYVPTEENYLKTFQSVNVICKKDFKLGACEFEFLDENLLRISINSTDVLCFYEAENNSMLNIRADLLIAMTDNSNVSAEKEVYFEKVDGKISVKATGNLHIRAEDGIISIKRRGEL